MGIVLSHLLFKSVRFYILKIIIIRIYALELLPAKSVVYLEGLYDRTVLHGHIINSIMHIGLKYYFLSDL